MTALMTPASEAPLAIGLRPMRPRDVASVQRLEQLVYPRPWSATLFHEELARDDRIYLVATVRDGMVRRPVVGYGGAYVAAGEAHVLTLVCDPGIRRRQVAARLLLQLLVAARQRGAGAATLEVRESNLAARTLYMGFGFVDAGARPGYYEDNGEDARILWLHGLDGPLVGAALASRGRAYGIAVPDPER